MNISYVHILYIFYRYLAFIIAVAICRDVVINTRWNVSGSTSGRGNRAWHHGIRPYFIVGWTWSDGGPRANAASRSSTMATMLMTTIPTIP